MYCQYDDIIIVETNMEIPKTKTPTEGPYEEVEIWLPLGRARGAAASHAAVYQPAQPPSPAHR